MITTADKKFNNTKEVIDVDCEKGGDYEWFLTPGREL